MNSSNPDPLLAPAEPAGAEGPTAEAPAAETQAAPAIEAPAAIAASSGELGSPKREVPHDLRVPWGWVDFIWFLLFAVISSIVLTALVEMFAVAILHAPGPRTHAGEALGPVVVVIGQVFWSGAALLYLFAMVRVRSEDPFWRTIGWHGLRGAQESRTGRAFLFLSGGAGMAVIVSVLGRLGGENNQLPIEKLFDSRLSVELLMVLGILIAPLVEETIFRGFLYPLVARQFGVAVGIVVTGVVFGLMHAAQLWGGWSQIALLIGVGIVLTWVRARTGTVAASYLMHLGYNGLLFIGLFLATGGLRHFPAGVLIR